MNLSPEKLKHISTGGQSGQPSTIPRASFASVSPLNCAGSSIVGQAMTSAMRQVAVYGFAPYSKFRWRTSGRELLLRYRSPEHPIDRRPADLERLGDVRGPNCPAPSVHAPARPLSKAVVPCRRPPPSPSRCPRAAARAALLSRLVLDRSFMPSRKRKVNPIKTQKVSRRADSLGSPFRWCTLRNRFMARFRLASAPSDAAASPASVRACGRDGPRHPPPRPGKTKSALSLCRLNALA
jgi:hypothetical protein